MCKSLTLTGLFVLLVVTAVLLLGIHKKSVTGKSYIRIYNASNVDMKDVRVNDHPYGVISSGQFSRYQRWEQPAYRYAAVSIVINGKKIEIIPDDYVGEKTLGEGNFTYELSLSKNNLEIHSTKDR